LLLEASLGIIISTLLPSAPLLNFTQTETEAPYNSPLQTKDLISPFAVFSATKTIEIKDAPRQGHLGLRHPTLDSRGATTAAASTSTTPSSRQSGELRDGFRASSTRRHSSAPACLAWHDPSRPPSAACGSAATITGTCVCGRVRGCFSESAAEAAELY